MEFVTEREIAEIVKELLDSGRYTQRSLAAELNLSQSTISHLKAGYAREFLQHIDTFFRLLRLWYEIHEGELRGSELVKLLQLVVAADAPTWQRATNALQIQKEKASPVSPQEKSASPFHRRDPISGDPSPPGVSGREGPERKSAKKVKRG